MRIGFGGEVMVLRLHPFISHNSNVWKKGLNAFTQVLTVQPPQCGVFAASCILSVAYIPQPPLVQEQIQLKKTMAEKSRQQIAGGFHPKPI